MPIETYCQGGMLVGELPRLGVRVAVPLRDVLREAAHISGATLSAAELAALDRYSGATVGAALEEVGAGKVARKLKGAVKKIAKSKIVKGIAKVVKKAVPPPFNMALGAVGGAVKLGKALKSKSAAQRTKAKKIVPAVRAAAAGKISSKTLARKARAVGVSPKVADDAATFKRLTMDANTNAQAAATVALAKDMADTTPAAQARAQQALSAEYAEPTTSRSSGEEYGLEPAPLYEEAVPGDEQAPQTEDPYGPEAVAEFEVDDGTPPPDDTYSDYEDAAEIGRRTGYW